MGIEPAESELLVDLADAAIVDGLRGQPPTAPALSVLPPGLQRKKGVFVTLTVDGELNGCIGTIEGDEPLGHGVARNAWSAAFADPRLPVLRSAEYERLVIEVSVLSLLEPIPAASRPDLLAQLRPRDDGLIIAAGRRRALFLPSVWEQLPEPVTFLDHLQLKAGLTPGSWPAGLQAFRFTAEKFTRRAGELGTPYRAA